MNRAAQEPCKDGSTASTQPETTSEVCPASAGEQICRGVIDGDVGGWDVWLFPRLVVKQEQQREDMYGSNGRQHPGGVLEFGGPQWTTDCEGAVEQVTKSSTCFEAAEIG